MKILFVPILLLFSAKAFGEFKFMVETGASWQSRNDVRIPNNSSGDRFDLSNFDQGAFFHHRFESIVDVGQRHKIRFVYAPLSLSVGGRFDQSVNYDNVSFNATDNVTVDYQFNSYRLGYVYGLMDTQKQKINLGLTLKIREADIRVSQLNTSASFDDFGFVPLFYFSYFYQFSKNWSLFFDADFAAASQGRALDAALKFRRELKENHLLGVGYRILEGGADNDEVLTFSLFHYAVLDLSIEF